MANRWGNSERFYFGTCSKITADVDCSHEIKKHFLLGRKAMINLVLVIQSCLTLCSPTDYSLWGSSVHGIFQTKILEWVAISFSRVNLNSPLKSRDITWPTKVHLVKAMVFPVVMHGYESKESWVPKNWCFWTVVLEKTLQSPLDYKETKPVNPKRNQPWIFIERTDAEAETPILWPSDVKNWLIWKDPDAGEDWRQEKKGMTEDEMVGWNHWCDGHEFE